MQAWETFLETLQKQFGEETVSRWLRPLKVSGFDACNLYLEAQHSFQIEWFEEHVRDIAKKTFLNSNSNLIKVHLHCIEQAPKEKKPKKIILSSAPTFSLAVDSLLPEMTRENFVFGSSNEILSALFTNFSHESSEQTSFFNPLFLYGKPCTGKTHLLQALAHEFKKKNKAVLFVKAETFTANVIHAIRSGNMQDFRSAHRHIDVLIFDNVQYLAKKAATQEEFFHTFNTLHSQGKLIILSADSTPALLQDIEPRLISRFEWGLSLPIHPLEKQDLIQMLKIRSEALSFPLSAPCIKFLVDTFSSNIKSLQLSIEALILRAPKTSPRSLTPALIKHILHDLIELEEKQILSPEHIVTCVASFFNLNSEDVLSRSQTQECATPRQIAMFLCRNELKMPFAKIGEHFKRDHSTVMTSVKSVEDKIDKQDKEVSSALTLIRQKMQQVR